MLHIILYVYKTFMLHDCDPDEGWTAGNVLSIEVSSCQWVRPSSVIITDRLDHLKTCLLTHDRRFSGSRFMLSFNVSASLCFQEMKKEIDSFSWSPTPGVI